MTAMITTPDQMQQAIEQLSRVYASLAALRREVAPVNPRNFATLAEGHVDEIRRLQQELDEYAGFDRASTEKVETHVGDLREIDLDECAFILRNNDPEAGQVRCYFPEEMLEGAKDALDKRIRVTGSRPSKEGRKTPPLMVSRLEILDER